MNAVRTLEHLSQELFDLRVICLGQRGSLLPRLQATGIPITEFAMPSLASVGALRAGIRFARWLRRERIDVLHSHDIYTNIFAVPWARLAGVPLVIASRRWWTETNRPEHRWLNRWSYRFAHRVLANSESVGQLVVTEGLPTSRLDVIPNFVDDAAFNAPPVEWVRRIRSELALTPEHTVVGIVANFHAIKDHASLLRAIALLVPQHRDIRVVLVGEGLERARLEDLANSLQIRPHVLFAGQRAHQPSMHWIFDVSVLCSRGEGFPNSVVEAMAAGRPVVATSVGGVADVVVDEETGFLVPPGDPAKLAAAIHRVLADRTLAEAMGAAGAVWVRQRFFADRVIAQLGALYRRVTPTGP